MLSDTHCVEARILPSVLKAAAIVDLGGGPRGQYFADKCCNDSASTLHARNINHNENLKKGSKQGPLQQRDKKLEVYHEVRLCPASLIGSLLVLHEESVYHLLLPHRFLGTNFAFGDISLSTSMLKTLLPLNNKFQLQVQRVSSHK